MSKYLMILGRSEPISFPKLNIEDVPAKIDTGAYRSAIHCTKAKVVTQEDGTEILRFTLLNNHPCAVASEVIETPNFSRVVVAN